MPAKVIAQLMGHAKVDTTLNVYAQVLDDSVRDAAERVGSKLITIDHTASKVAATTHCVGSQTLGNTSALVFAISRSYGVCPFSAPCGRW